MVARAIKSAPKLKLIEFIKTAKEGDEFEFTLSMNTNAEKFVHRMRVELSRLRSKLIEMGKVASHFKMMLEKIEVKTGLDANNKPYKYQVVTLKRTTSANDVTQEVSEALAALTVGDKINV